MTIEHMTYARVAHKVTPPSMVPRPHSERIDKFLLDHYRALLRKAENKDSPMAFFVDQQAHTLFKQLQSGSENDFLNAAHTLSVKLVGQMDGRMEPGLFICMRVLDGDRISAAVLKLEVVTPNSAVLERLESGEEVLEAVTNVLDAPGELQKGALIDDPRTDSDVVVGDKLAKDALYFPRAFGIKTEARAADGTAELVAALDSRIPSITARVLEVLPSIDGTETAQVLATIAEEVPELTSDIQAEVAAALEQRQRPVRRVSPKAPIRSIVRAGSITISGSTSGMRAVSWNQLPDGKWRITIDVPEEPQQEYR